MKIFALLVAALVSSTAFGSTITINLVNSTLSGVGGATLTFSGSLTNTTSVTENLNIPVVNVSSVPPFSHDETPFFNNAPFFLTANQTTASFALFTVTIPTSLALGVYNGAFTILGGPGANDQAVIGTTTFSVQVVPEPATWGLMFAALAAFLVTRRIGNDRQLARIPNN